MLRSQACVGAILLRSFFSKEQFKILSHLFCPAGKSACGKKRSIALPGKPAGLKRGRRARRRKPPERNAGGCEPPPGAGRGRLTKEAAASSIGGHRSNLIINTQVAELCKRSVGAVSESWVPGERYGSTLRAAAVGMAGEPYMGQRAGCTILRS